MTFEEFKNALFDSALKKGCDAAEVYAASTDGFSVNVLKGDIIKYSVERNTGLNLRVLYNGKSGYAYTEVYEDADSLVDHAIDNARVIENTDVNPMQGKCEYPEIEKKPNPIVDMAEDEKINIALNLERDTLGFDDRVNRMAHGSVDTGVSVIATKNIG